jgi:Phage integrase family
MNAEVLQFGSEIAQEARGASENCVVELANPKTLGNLMKIWAQDPPRQHAMLRTTTARLADYLETPVEDIPIETVERSRRGFRAFLEGRKYGENSIRTYVNHVRILLDIARAAGWELQDSMSEEWKRVLGLTDDRRCKELVWHLISIRKTPHEVTTEDVDEWVRSAAQRGFAYRSATKRRSAFWRILRDCGYAQKLPPCILREKNYGISIAEFPSDLKQEVTELLKWKQDFYRYDRPKGARHRPPTAKRLRHVICALYGFAVNVKGETGIRSLSGLAQQHIVGTFIEWCMSERQVKGQTLQRNLRLVDGVLRQHPRYKGLDFAWFKPMLDGIPAEPDSVLNQRKAEKTLEYSVIEMIPGKIQAQRPMATMKGKYRLALLVQDELMVRWLSVLPWRQRNLRECRIAGPTPNLYKRTVPDVTTIDMPNWAAEERRRNPNVEFWQFRFTEEETKTGCAVEALLPRQLIAPLEEYLNEHRTALLKGSDPGTLFLNQHGRPMTLNQVTRVISQNTLRHGGRRVTPHLFRDVVCRAWLKAHPKDYLTLSKLLWHSSPKEVISTYGSLFNESSGVCSMEAWLEERNVKQKS